jgi:O-acetyl-ADP-ribose deacetylase (regulator of RNase III)
MPIEFVEGNLFDPMYSFDAYAHGCNCQGLMGAGIAKEFKKLYPDMFKKYQDLCDKNLFRHGEIFIWDEKSVSGLPAVINMATQQHIGSCARLEYVERCCRKIDKIGIERGYDWIGMPRIGCGIGGLSWRYVKQLLKDIFTRSVVQVTVFERFKP